MSVRIALVRIARKLLLHFCTLARKALFCSGFLIPVAHESERIWTKKLTRINTLSRELVAEPGWLERFGIEDRTLQRLGGSLALPGCRFAGEQMWRARYV